MNGQALQVQGKVISVEAQSGMGNSGKPWTKYSYKLETPEGERTYSSFKDYGQVIGQNVLVTYVEKDNPNGQYPYKNVTQMTLVQGTLNTVMQQPQAQPVQQQVNKKAELEAFVTVYLANVPMQQWSINHLIGTFYRSKDKSKFLPFEEVYNRLIEPCRVTEDIVQ